MCRRSRRVLSFARSDRVIRRRQIKRGTGGSISVRLLDEVPTLHRYPAADIHTKRERTVSPSSSRAGAVDSASWHVGHSRRRAGAGRRPGGVSEKERRFVAFERSRFASGLWFRWLANGRGPFEWRA